MKASVTSNKALTNIRAVASSVLVLLLEQKGSLTNGLKVYKSREDYALLQELCFGTCRHYFSLEFILNELTEKPLRAKDKDIKCLLLIGLYQLRHMSLPDYAVINETVSAASLLKKPWSRGLLNGVLRNYLRETEALDKKLSQSPAHVRFDNPEWLSAEIQHCWPEHWQQILHGSNHRPPMTLRVNLSRISRPRCIEKLEEKGIQASVGNLAESAVYLQKPVSVEQLPGFVEGELSVQDEASQLIPSLLQLAPNQRVLDSCAAPGGKTCHLLESAQLNSLTSLDVAASRMARVNENLSRLQLEAMTKIADARDLGAWWDGVLFDRILLDAPCSATGVIRRHPDIKLLRKPEHIDELNTLQLEILEAAWSTLKPNGLLLYTTCSVLPRENSELLRCFLDSTDNAKYEGIKADWGVECSLGRQLLPSDDSASDGFFFSLLRKSP